MRILLSAYACDPHSGSEGRTGWNWALHLAKEGHEVWVLTSDRFGSHASRIDHARDAGNLHFLQLRIPRMGNLLLHGLPGVYIHYLLWLRESYEMGRRLVRLKHFDLAHHVTWGSLMWGSPLWRLGVPFVLGPVGGGQTTPPSLAHYVGRHWRGERLRSIVMRFGMRRNPLARATARHADVVLVTNSETGRLVRHLGARVVHLVPDSAVPPTLAHSNRHASAAHDAISILWLAHLYPIKGLPLALDALSRISPDVKWACTIVGDGPLAPEVPTWLERYGVVDRTTWTGGVPWPEIGRMYEGADVFLFTSLRDSLGSQLYEAVAFGLPIVALNHAGVRDLIPDEVAVKVAVGSPEQTAQGLARAIEVLARDPGRRRAMSGAATRFAQRNTWPERVGEAYAIIQAHLADKTAE